MKKITKEERSTIAARLRKIDPNAFYCLDHEEYLLALEEAIGYPLAFDWGLVHYLADLIEPEPERVLKMTPAGRCPDCKKLIGTGESYCGYCGARMVEQRKAPFGAFLFWGGTIRSPAKNYNISRRRKSRKNPVKVCEVFMSQNQISFAFLQCSCYNEFIS